MCATLAAGRAARWRALTAVRAVPKYHFPCRKWPSTPLIRGSPFAVTVASASVHMPVRTWVSCSAVRVRSVKIERRCALERDIEASSRAWSSSSSSGLSRIGRGSLRVTCMQLGEPLVHGGDGNRGCRRRNWALGAADCATLVAAGAARQARNEGGDRAATTDLDRSFTCPGLVADSGGR